MIKKSKKNTNKKKSSTRTQYGCEESIILGSYGRENSNTIEVKTDSMMYLRLPKSIHNISMQPGQRIKLKMYRNRDLENAREMSLLTAQKKLIKETAPVSNNSTPSP